MVKYASNGIFISYNLCTLLHCTTHNHWLVYATWTTVRTAIGPPLPVLLIYAAKQMHCKILGCATHLSMLGKLHDNPDGRLGADANQPDDVGVIKLLHNICKASTVIKKEWIIYLRGYGLIQRQEMTNLL